MPRAEPVKASRGRALVLVMGMVVGCGRAGNVPVVTYDGHRESARVQMGMLRRVNSLAEDETLLGTVTAACRREPVPQGALEMALGTLDCTQGRLARLVEERAVSVGATALHRFACEQYGDVLECSANAVASASAKPAVDPRFRARDEAIAKATVAFIPDSGVTIGSPWPEAIELDYVPVSDRRLGLLRATVSCPGRAEDARLALFQAARTLGAAHVVSPRCERGEDHRATCSAVISTPRQDPRLDGASRWELAP